MIVIVGWDHTLYRPYLFLRCGNDDETANSFSAARCLCNFVHRAGGYGFVGGSGVALWQVLAARPEEAVEDTTLWQLRTALVYALGGKAVGLTLSVVYVAYHKLRVAQAVSDNGAPLPKMKGKATKQS